jgi:hypothetical protein
MKPSDLYGVVIRVFGLYILLRGLWRVWWAALLQTGAAKSDPMATDAVINDYLFEGAAWFMLGMILMRCASWIVAFSYPKEASIADSDTQDATHATGSLGERP